ncbi:Proline racemase family [Fusarium oxysporum f. sp. vasinfectum]|nr:Proline racemase family [Fusarium oxysporum f. sp. vasinfectum]
MADKSSYWVESEDWHTAGEPFRIIQHLPSGFLPEVQTVSERRIEIVKTKDHPLDRLRIFLSHEPRGHADMYEWGVDVVIDVPSGRVVASVTRKDGKSIYADFVNVSTYQIAKGLSVAIPSRDSDISVDLTFAGAVIASVDTTQLGLEVKPSNANEFIRIQREIKASLGDRAKYGPNELYAMLFFEEEENGKGSGWIVQKSINVYGDGQIDRSPCGGRMAILLAEGRL